MQRSTASSLGLLGSSLVPWYAVLFLMSYPYSAQAQPGVQAECSLVLKGYGSTSRRPGLAAAGLACNSAGGPVPIGINTTYLQEFAASCTGVEISGLPCQQYAAEFKIPAHALFYLCGNLNVTFVSAVVQDVWLEDLNDTSLHMAALVAFGGNAVGSFIDSQVTNSAGPTVVVMQDAQVLLQNTSITNSTSKIAAWAYAFDHAHLAIIDCQLVNATSSGVGLAVSDTASASIVNTSISGNTVESFAAIVLAAHRSQLHIINSSFTHNLETGVRAINQSQVVVAGGVFTNNQAEFGAAVRALDHSNITMYDNNISYNNATSGGAVHLYGESSLTIHRSMLHGNTATQYGGAIYSEGANKVQLKACVLTSNGALAWQGGAIRLYGQSSLSIHRSMLHGNTATRYGGAIYSEGANKVQMKASVLTSNRAFWAGGALASYANTVLTTDNCIFGNNHAKDGGGLALYDDTVCHFVNNSMKTNSAESSGGGISVGNQAQVFVSGCIFAANNASVGGALLSQGQSVITFSRSELNFNKATTGGGADAAGQSSLRFVQSQLHGNRADLLGGALSCGGAAKVHIEKSNLTANQAGSQGGGVLTAADASLTMSYCFVDNNTAQFGGGLTISGNSKAKLHGNNISSNTATEVGGGVYALDEAQVILSSLVIGNRAGKEGGGLYLARDVTVSIHPGSDITHNYAVMSGGGFAAMGSGFVASDVKAVTHNNTALADMDIHVTTSSLTLLSNSSVTGLVDKVGTDTGILPVTLLVAGLHGVPVEGEVVAAYLDSREPLDTSISNSQGLVRMLIRVRKPPGKYTIRFQLKEDGPPGPAPTPNVTVEVRGCIKGEVSPAPAVCQDCLAGFYSLDPSKQVCDVCPAGATCPGGAAIIPDPGYWHSTVDSNQIHRCPNPSACGQDNQQLLACTKSSTCNPAEHIQQQCSGGYMGNVCGMCRPGFGLSKPFHCEHCPTPAKVIAFYVIGPLVMLVCVAIFCLITLSGNMSAALDDPDQQAAELLHCLVLYSQRLLIVGELAIEWPATMAVPFKILAGFWSLSSGETLSTDCWPSSAHAILPLAAQRLVFYLCMPVAMLVVVVILGKVYTHIKSGEVCIPSIAIVVIFFFLPALLRITFGLFACISLDQQADSPAEIAAVGAFWVQDLSTQCFTGYHRWLAFGVGLPLMVMLLVALPVLMWWKTYFNSEGLNNVESRTNYGFLTKSYKLPSRRCWEAWVVLETVALVVVSVFGISLGPFYQCLLMIVVLMVLLQMQYTFKPYARSRTKYAVIWGQRCLLFTTVVGASFLPYNDTYPKQEYGLAMGVVLLLVNLAYVVYMLVVLYKAIQWRELPKRMQRWKSSVTQWTARTCGKWLSCCGCCIRSHNDESCSTEMASTSLDGGLHMDGPEV